MSSAEDSAFADMAIEMGLLSRKTIETSLETLRVSVASGSKLKLSDVLQERDILSRSQVRDVYRALHQLGMYPRIGNYEIMVKLGQGAMGRVYQARQVDTGRIVALKVLPRRLSRNERFLGRFLAEAAATSKLHHENIVQALDVGEANGYHYFAMEYIRGRTVRDLMERHGPIDEERALDITVQVARALKHVSEYGIIHRDIKPSNIMITVDGSVKLCDLGLAKEMSTEEEKQITLSGTAVGTAYYISPEQARGQGDLDVRSDIYSLGATLYHMIVGEVPFDGSSPAVVMTKHVTEPLPPPKERNLALSDHVCNIVEKMMAKDRERRYQTPDELIEDIELALEGRPPGAALASYVASDSTAESEAVIDPAAQAAATSAMALLRHPPKGAVLVALTIVLAAAMMAWAVAFSPRRSEQVALQTRKDCAKSIYRITDKYATTHPEDYLGVLIRLQMVTEAAAGTDYARQAELKMAAVRRRLNDEAEPVFQRLKDEADEFIANRHFAQAFEVWERFPGQYAIEEWRGHIKAEKAQYRAMAKAQYERLDARAKELIAEGNFKAAIETYRMAEVFSVPEITALAFAAVRQTEAKQKEAKAQEMFQDALAALQEKQYHKAKRLVIELLSFYPEFHLTTGEAETRGKTMSLAELKAELEDTPAVITVSQDGAGDYTTIQDALLAAWHGDVVEVRDAGVYREPAIGYNVAGDRFDAAIVQKRNICLRGVGARPTIMNNSAGPSDYLMGCGPDWRVENIEFAFANGLHVRSGPITLSRCRFRGDDTVAVGLAGSFGVATIDNCVFKDVRAVVEIHEVALPSSRVVFRHNVTTRAQTGFTRAAPSSGVLVSASNSIWMDVSRAVVLDQAGYGEIKWSGDGNCYWEVVAFYETSSPDGPVTIGDMEQWRDANSVDRLSIVAEPLFDPAQPDAYRLLPHSPCRRAGVGSVDIGLEPQEAGQTGQAPPPGGEHVGAVAK